MSPIISAGKVQQLYIPVCGDRLQLVRPWTFSLVFERRNIQFAEAIGALPKILPRPWWREDCFDKELNEYKQHEVTLPAGTILSCDRVYIRQTMRQNKDSYDSITWRAYYPNKVKSIGRFWANMPDCFKIQFVIHSLQHDKKVENEQY